jgi:hypothetical protein
MFLGYQVAETSKRDESQKQNCHFPDVLSFLLPLMLGTFTLAFARSNGDWIGEQVCAVVTEATFGS